MLVDEDPPEASFFSCWAFCQLHGCPSITAVVRRPRFFFFVGHTFGEPRRDHRALDGPPLATLTLRTLFVVRWMTRPVYDEKCLGAHVKCEICVQIPH